MKIVLRTKVFEGNCTVLDHKGSTKVPILLHIFKDFLYGKYEIPLVYIKNALGGIGFPHGNLPWTLGLSPS